MNTFLLILSVIVAIALFTSWIASRPRGHQLFPLANIGEGTHAGPLTKFSDAAIATRYLLGKFGSDVNHVAVAGANDKPLGIIADEASAAEEPVAVQLLGVAESTRKCVTSEAIALTDELYTAANGKVQNLPAAAGTYYKVGRPLQAAAGADEVIEFEPCFPVAVVVP